MKELNRVISTTPANILDIRFWPTDICNFNCEYCFPGSVLNVNKFPTNVGTVIKNFRLLLDEYERSHGKDFFRINIVGGGEPTLWPYLAEFCAEIKKHNNVELKLTTNGSRKTKWFEENTSDIDKFTMSCHHKEVDIEQFVKNCDFLWERGSHVGTLMLMDAKNWDKCIELLECMYNSKYSWPIQAKEVVDAPSFDFNSYTDEQKNFFTNSFKRIPDGNYILDNINEINYYQSVALYDNNNADPATPNFYIANSQNYFKGWFCSVPIENLVIAHDGKITGSCQEEIFNDVNLNLFSENFEVMFNRSKLDLDEIICPRNCCSCQPDTHISKRKS